MNTKQFNKGFAAAEKNQNSKKAMLPAQFIEWLDNLGESESYIEGAKHWYRLRTNPKAPEHTTNG